MTTEIPLSTSGETAIGVARKAAIKAGSILTDKFLKVNKVSFKGRGNIVTDVDTEVEFEILSILRNEFPQMKTLGEESAGASPEKGYVWIVDPLDGTRNYVSGIPFYSVVIGLACDGEVLVGVNYDPVRQEMFEAERGNGAFLNGNPIKISEKTSIESCVIGMDLSYNNIGAATGLSILQSIWPGMQTARIMGSAALGISYAASGRTDLYFHHRLEPWDQVAGILLVEEAGGVITDRLGNRASINSDGLIASNATLHAEFMKKTNGSSWTQPQ